MIDLRMAQMGPLTFVVFLSIKDLGKMDWYSLIFPTRNLLAGIRLSVCFWMR